MFLNNDHVVTTNFVSYFVIYVLDNQVVEELNESCHKKTIGQDFSINFKVLHAFNYDFYIFSFNKDWVVKFDFFGVQIISKLTILVVTSHFENICTKYHFPSFINKDGVFMFWL
jgi:hypothetical protein